MTSLVYPTSPHEDPEDAIAVVDARALHAALEDCDLLSKGNVLDRESTSVCEQRVDECEE